MSTNQNPIAATFEIQRDAVLQSQKTVQQSLEFGARASEMYVEALKSSAVAAEGSTDVTKAAVNTYFDALVASVPGNAEGIEELRASVLEQVDAGAEIGAETRAAIEEAAEENVETYEEFAEAYAELVDDSFDAFLAAHDDVAEHATAAAEQATAAAEEFEAQLEDDFESAAE